MYLRCPFGERRADMRAAINTARVCAALSMSETKAEDVVEIAQSLQRYLKCERDDEESAYDPEALQRMKEQLDGNGPS